MKFLALDFETANHLPDSACALGLVRVEDNKIVEKKSFLIKPPYSYFTFTYLHGIDWNTVKDQPDFQEHWFLIKPFFDNIDFVTAHNAVFDRKVLTSCCKRHRITEPYVDFQCTMKLSRKFLGIYPTNLPAVCKNLHIELNHHNALSDALACAKIMIEIQKKIVP